MKIRKWTGKQKLQIVMEGFKEKAPISELCNRFEIGQSQYYRWRDQFIKKGASIFDEKPDKKIEQLESKVKKLTSYVGELTIELKKTEDELEWLES
ncbi:MAG: transposase [Sphingomonadales bacterium]